MSGGRRGRRSAGGLSLTTSLLALALVGDANNAAAGTSVTVVPAMVELNVEPGRSGAQEVQFINRGVAPVTVEARAWDWRLDAEGRRVTLPAGTAPDSLAHWLVIRPLSVTVPPKSAARFTITVSVPTGARGGRYATVYLSTVSGPRASQRTVRLGAELGVRVLVQTGLAEPSLESQLIELSAPTTHSNLRARVRLHNSGDVHLWATPSIDLLGPAGDFVGTLFAPKPRYLLLPGETTEVELEWPGELAPASYEAIAVTEFSANETSLTRLEAVQVILAQARFTVEPGAAPAAVQPAAVQHLPAAAPVPAVESTPATRPGPKP